MIEDLFEKELSVDRYLNPFEGFQEKTSSFEIRRDAIADVTARILPYRFRVFQRPDVSVYLEKSPTETCPFCLPQRESLTPRFLPDVHPQGRFHRGEAWLFPNAFPHGQHNAISLFSNDHFLPMDALKPSLMRDAFQVCQVYFQRMAQIDRGLQYVSINWNYMPPSGGGLLHPHLQTIISDKPTRFVQNLYASARRFEARTGCRLWEELVAAEKAAEERYIGAVGSVQWLTSFAPRGMAGELAFFLPECRSLLEMTDDAWGDILDGLARVLAFLDAVNLLSFNLALYGTLREDRHLCVQGRIIPRILILPLGASDVNYFDKLHGETICPVTPEQICGDIRPWFEKR